MGKKILVVDDDMVGITLMAGRLAKEGYEVTKAMNGVEGLKCLAAAKIDLIILDIEMPGMNGYEFVGEMSKVNAFKDIPVIVLTAHEENRRIFARRGIYNYQVKPVNFEILLPLMQKLLFPNPDPAAPA